MDRLRLLTDWLADVTGKEDVSLVAKRLAANDTGATRTKQVGIYLPKDVAFALVPELTRQETNPKHEMQFQLVSHNQSARPVLTYYNNLTRDESRITRFGGARSAIQDPENTGALLLLCFDAERTKVEGWLAINLEEEELIEGVTGPIIPGAVILIRRRGTAEPQVIESLPDVAALCRPDPSDLPSSWLTSWPTGKALTEKAASLAGADLLDPDTRLLRRLRCEYELFKTVEDVHVLPLIRSFDAVEPFLKVAHTVINRRMSRAGRSLELQLQHVFTEEDIPHTYKAITERGNEPDFLFPSIAAYEAAGKGSPSIKMLGVKTTLKDRWRQILPEAEKIPEKHLFTLAEGVSLKQFQQISAENVTLVVPQANITRFPDSVRSELLTLDAFLGIVRQ